MNLAQLGWQLLAGWLAIGVAMIVAWIWQRRTRNASVVDVVWTFSTGSLAVFYALSADGLLSRRILIALLFACWALRLGLHLLPRLFHGEEDQRYQTMRREFGSRADLRFLLFFQTQAIASPLFASVAWLAGHITTPLSAFDIVGASLALIAVLGEWLADRQLAQFRAQQQISRNGKKVCDVGLWHYSRHPNYFFEWLYWCSLVLLAISSPWWWMSLGAPVAMFYFLNFVTGIPPAEAQAIAKRGDEYREYQKRTSAFFPWPPG